MDAAPCPVCGYDWSELSPPDGVVAIRSFPRRFRELFERAEEKDPGSASRPGASGWSAADHAAWTARALAELDTALTAVNVSDRPTLAVPPLAGTQSATDPITALQALGTAAGRLAADAEAIRGLDWQRAGIGPAGEEWTALDLLRRAVHTGVHHLREAGRLLA